MHKALNRSEHLAETNPYGFIFLTVAKSINLIRKGDFIDLAYKATVGLKYPVVTFHRVRLEP